MFAKNVVSLHYERTAAYRTRAGCPLVSKGAIYVVFRICLKWWNTLLQVSPFPNGLLKVKFIALPSLVGLFLWHKDKIKIWHLRLPAFFCGIVKI